MFRKKCSNCNEKVGKKFDFCPNCGARLKSNKNKPEYIQKDYGILGKDDIIDESPIIDNTSISKLLGKALRELPRMVRQMEKEMNSQFNEPSHLNKSNTEFPFGMRIRFAINGKEIDLNELENGSQEKYTEKTKPVMSRVSTISKEKAEKFAKLPKKEPKSQMRRLSNKIIYELEVPGVNNINDILINKLENSIEIKALAKNKVYSKTININLPILKYKLAKENLILELQAK